MAQYRVSCALLGRHPRPRAEPAADVSESWHHSQHARPAATPTDHSTATAAVNATEPYAGRNPKPTTANHASSSGCPTHASTCSRAKGGAHPLTRFLIFALVGVRRSRGAAPSGAARESRGAAAPPATAAAAAAPAPRRPPRASPARPLVRAAAAPSGLHLAGAAPAAPPPPPPPPAPAAAPASVAAGPTLCCRLCFLLLSRGSAAASPLARTVPSLGGGVQFWAEQRGGSRSRSSRSRSRSRSSSSSNRNNRRSRSDFGGGWSRSWSSWSSWSRSRSSSTWNRSNGGERGTEPQPLVGAAPTRPP